MFLCLQARVGSAWDASRGAAMDPGGTKACGIDGATPGPGRGRGRGEDRGQRGCAAEWASYLFELQLGPPANVGIGVEGCYYATSNGGGIHLDVKMRACTYRGEGVVCLEAGEGREGVCVDACVVRLLCGLRSALRCGAVRWVNNGRLSRMAPNKNLVFGGQKRPRAGPQRGSGNQLQYRSRGVTVTARSRLSVRRGVLLGPSAFGLPQIPYIKHYLAPGS